MHFTLSKKLDRLLDSMDIKLYYHLGKDLGMFIHDYGKLGNIVSFARNPGRMDDWYHGVLDSSIEQDIACASTIVTITHPAVNPEMYHRHWTF
jgi:hypothetical protein